MKQAAQGPFRTGLRVPPILPLPWDFPDLPTLAQTIPLPEMLPIPHPARPSSGDTTSESPQCSLVIQYTGCIPVVAPGWRPTLALRKEKHEGKEGAVLFPTSGSGTPGTPAPRPPSGSQLGVSWPGGRAPILAGGGRRGISGHSSAQWLSRFSKGSLDGHWAPLRLRWGH